MFNKDYYRSFKPNGFRWVAYCPVKKLHYFTKPIKGSGWAELTCTEDMLTNGDLDFMANNGLTYAGGK